MIENVPISTTCVILIIVGILIWTFFNRKHGGMICLSCKSKYKEKHVQINLCPKCNGVLIKDNIELNPLLKKIFCIQNGTKQLKNIQQNSKKQLKNIEIQVPPFMDSSFGARSITIGCLPSFYDYIYIKDRQLIYKTSENSTKKNKSFDLDNMKKFLLSKKKCTGLTKDFKIDPWGLIGTEIELYIVDAENNRDILIPKFLIPANGFGQKRWETFLYELCEYSDLPLEGLVKPAES